MTETTELKLALEVKTRALAKAQADFKQVSERLNAARREAIAAHEAKYESEYATHDALEETIAELREQVKELALQAAEAYGTKKPAPGVGIREVRELRYKDADAIRWAIKVGKEAEFLAPKKRPLEKALRALEPEFVEVVVKKQVTIAQNLDKIWEDDGSKLYGIAEERLKEWGEESGNKTNEG